MNNENNTRFVTDDWRMNDATARVMRHVVDAYLAADNEEEYNTHIIGVVHNVLSYFWESSHRDSLIRLALIHDCLEDKLLSLGDCQQLLTLQEQKELFFLTHQEQDSYDVYVDRCCGSEMACIVKLCDSMQNFSRSITSRHHWRAGKYAANIVKCNTALARKEFS